MADAVQIYNGDCLDVLRSMPGESVDAIVTDPPYGLAFMGKKWDYDVPSLEVWAECLRVLKPGGHLLAFAGTRTQHRMAVRIEDAGFEIRDMIAWVYGSGFPKSHNVAVAIDKQNGVKPRGKSFNMKGGGERAEEFAENGREFLPPYEAATESARQWQGWGTALKPALEPITVARKPLIGTVAENVLAHGTGALNIDECRIGHSKDVPASVSRSLAGNSLSGSADRSLRRETGLESGHDPNTGRWPANLIHDGSEEVLAGFPETRARGNITAKRTAGTAFFGKADMIEPGAPGDTGSAARFFKTCKWSDDDWHPLSSNGPPVNTAGTPSGSCETPIAHAPVETSNSDFRSEASPVIPASTGNCNDSTQAPDHAPSAVTPENTATIQTTVNPSSLSGYAPHATAANTNSESAARVEGVNVPVQGTRFLYNAKASKRDRDEGLNTPPQPFVQFQTANGTSGKPSSLSEGRNTEYRNAHPTVKPTDLMRYLCRLVTPPGGVVLDPFMGSGSTGKAAVLEGFRFIGIEREAEYAEIAKARIAHVQKAPKQEALL